MNPILFTITLSFLILVVGVGTWYSGRILCRFVPPKNLLLSLPDNLARLFLIFVCVGLGLWLGPGAAQLGWSTDQLARDFALGAVAGALLAPLFMWAGDAVVRRWGAEMYDNRLLRAIVPVNRREWASVMVVLLPAAALEELLFRSLPLGGLTWLVSPWVLIWPMSLLFGLMHASQGQWGVAGAALMGLLLSALFLWTGSIWVPIVTHWMLNAVEVTIAQRRGVRPLRTDG